MKYFGAADGQKLWFYSLESFVKKRPTILDFFLVGLSPKQVTFGKASNCMWDKGT